VTDHGPRPAVDDLEWATGRRIGFRPFRYDPKVFSPRVRAAIPSRYLAAAGLQSSMVPADGSGRYDCVVFQKAYAKADLALAERLRAAGGKVVFDLCDNHFHHPEGNPGEASRIERLHAMLEMADAVSVSTPELAKLVDTRRAFVVDDALEIPSVRARVRKRVDARRRRDHGRRPLRLVWQGNSGSPNAPSALVGVRNLLPELERLHRTTPLVLTVISNSDDAFARELGDAPIPVRYVRWKASSANRHFMAHDICVLPINVTPFTVCKSNNRPILSLLLGVPVVADEIPSYRELAAWVPFGDWTVNLKAYADDPELGRRHVADATGHITATYTPQRVVEQWLRPLRAVLDGSPNQA